jgi:hypothetical protein
MKKFSGNNIFPIINNKFANAILMTFFTQEKGTLLPEKGHLAKLGGPAPPGSYTPASHTYVIKSRYKLFKQKII